MSESSDNSIVRFEDVSLRFGDTPALDRVSFSMAAGETRIVFGAAGSGKTVLLKVAVGLMKPDAGRVFLFGQEITGLKEQELFDIRAKVGILFQEGGLFDSMTIAENVGYPLLNQKTLAYLTTPNGSPAPDGAASNGALRNESGPNGSLPNGAGGDAGTGGAGHGSPDHGFQHGVRSVEDRVREALRFVELEHTLEKVPAELSGGMRRRVGIARAVVTEPALMLYDSPTAGLDPITAHTIVALILKERDLRNTGTIMVTHRYQDGHLMANFRYNPNSGEIEPAPKDGSSHRTTHFMVMNEGRLVFEGPEPELQASQDAYVRKFLRPVGG